MRHWVIRLAMAVGMTSMATMGAAQEKPRYPATRADKLVEELHGVSIPDPYRWLEDGDNADVRAWTDKQNSFTRGVLDPLPQRKALRERLEVLLSIGRISAATPARGKYFYSRRRGTQNHAILYVRDGLQGEDRVILDPNKLSADGTTALDWSYLTDDGALMAYGLSEKGSEESTLLIRDVKTLKDLPLKIPNTRAASVAWLPDNSGFYYTRYPAVGDQITEVDGKTRAATAADGNYYRHVFFHKLGADPAKDPKVFGNGHDKEDWPNVALSPDGKWLLITVEQGWSRTEVYLKERAKPDSPFVPVVEKKDHLYGAAVHSDTLFIRTNEGAPRYRVFKTDPSKPQRENWKEIIPESKDVLDGISPVGDKLIGLASQNATSRLRVFGLDGKIQHEVALPTLGTIEGLGAEWNGSEVFFGFSSFTYPPSVYRLDLKDNQTKLWQRVDTDLNVADYEVRQVRYPSKDGTSITMFLAHKKGIKQDGNNPVVLTGYGGFNANETPTWGASMFPFLEKGGVLAVPNLRGGGEYGEEWHQAGMLGKKQNVFDDFIAAAEWLIKEKYTTSKRLAIVGGSNGGLLVGAAAVQRPDLFRAVVCQVPLLDMLRYHKFRIARLWIPEYGDPENRTDFEWLRAYSPYHHVKPSTAYPAMLLTAAESDTRVDPLHARKMAARLQAATTGVQPILLRIETKAGHGAGKPRSLILEELVDQWSFIFWQMGIN